MPIISMFYGIIIRLYLIDNKHHNLPHFMQNMLSTRRPSASLMVKFFQVICHASSCVWCKRG